MWLITEWEGRGGVKSSEGGDWEIFHFFFSFSVSALVAVAAAAAAS